MIPTIGPATPGEIDVLTEIAHRAKAHWGYPEGWMRSWNEELTILPGYLDQAVVNVARIGGRPVGFYALVPAKERRQDWELDHLWVSPDNMGRGIGRALLTHAIREVSGRGGHSIFILSDPNAEAFYSGMGAHTIGRAEASMDEHQRWLPEMELVVGSGKITLP